MHSSLNEDQVRSSDGYFVADCERQYGGKLEGIANAAFIVKACNDYAANLARIARLTGACELLDAALEDLLNARVVEVSEAFVQRRLMSREALNQARAALAKE